MFALVKEAIDDLRCRTTKRATQLTHLVVHNIAAVRSPANKRPWLLVKQEGPMRPTFDDFLHDTELANTHRARTKQGGEGIMAAKKSGVELSTIDFEKVAQQIINEAVRKATMTAVDELEEKVAERLRQFPAETRQVATHEIFTADRSLYDRVRAESVDTKHGETLRQVQDRASGSFGVNQRGEPVTKTAHSADEEVTIKARMVMAKSADGISFEQAMNIVFQNQPELYERWKRESQA